MPLRDTIETIVNIILVLGFIILVSGIGLWILNLSQRLYLSTEAMLVLFGSIFLIFGTLAARLFSRM